MKNARILIALLVLLAAAPLAEAQIMVSSTTASTQRIYEKSGREKGFVIRPEMTLAAIIGNCTFTNLNATFAYQLNPYFTIGAGTGLNRFSSAGWNTYESIRAIPLYANARVYFCDRKWSPFFDLKIGFDIPLNQTYYIETDSYYYREYRYSLKGLVLCGTFGVQYKNFDFGCIVGALQEHEKYYYHSENYYDNWEGNYIPGLLLGGYVAYNIPFKK